VGASIGLLAERAVRGLVRETEHRWGIAPVVRCTLGVALVGWSLRMWTVRKFAGVVKFFVVMFLFVWSSSHVARISVSSSALCTAPLVADLFYRCRPQVYVPHTDQARTATDPHPSPGLSCFPSSLFTPHCCPLHARFRACTRSGRCITTTMTPATPREILYKLIIDWECGHTPLVWPNFSRASTSSLTWSEQCRNSD
jgi:hypothetical protein